MTFFTSEYESKLDAKGRLVLPSRIKAQLPEGGGNELVIRRGFEQCLILYPMVEFRKVFSKISSLNEFNEEYRKLQRNFLSGVVTVELDNNGRFLIPKNMLDMQPSKRMQCWLGWVTKWRFGIRLFTRNISSRIRVNCRSWPRSI